MKQENSELCITAKKSALSRGRFEFFRVSIL